MSEVVFRLDCKRTEECRSLKGDKKGRDYLRKEGDSKRISKLFVNDRKSLYGPSHDPVSPFYFRGLRVFSDGTQRKCME